MKIESLLLIIPLVIIVGCNTKQNKDYLNLKVDTSKLVTVKDKRNFLEQILEDDQKVRDGEAEAKLMLKYGKGSKEHMEYIKAQWRQDGINLKKIEAYFEKFDYPSKIELGRDAVTAPWLVIHHSTDTGIRDRHFEILYKAYLNGDIDDTAMSLYLGRTYEKIFGERHQMENPYKSEDQINQLIQKLDLDERKANIQH